MNRRPSCWRALVTAAALCAAAVLAGCQTDGLPASKALQPLSPKMLALLQEKDMAVGSPMLVRIFKEESELEVWKQDSSGRFALLKTYPMCRWSGELGPKIKEGDRQAPEGFYTITPGQMNPNSNYYLSFNIGYPNAYDRAWGRTGSELMVHGDCSSRGCYAMTDQQIGEIYALARESFFGGQTAFQVQAYPFRMTALNMARHRNNPNMAFWRMLKRGYDLFEVTRAEPKVNVCERRYVFDAEQPANASRPLHFNPTGKCPAYTVDPQIASALKEKTDRDNAEFAAYARRKIATAPIRTGRDGGMHPSFLAQVEHQVHEPDGTVKVVYDEAAMRRLGSYVNPPKDPDAPAAEEVRAPSKLASAAPARPAREPSASSRVAAAQPSSSGGFFANLFGSGSDKDKSKEPSRLSRLGKWFGAEEAEKPAAPPQRAPVPRPAPRQHHPVEAAAKPKPESRPAAEPKRAPARVAEPEQVAAPAPQPQPASEPQSAPARAATIPGSQPIVQADSFSSRFGAIGR